MDFVNIRILNNSYCSMGGFADKAVLFLLSNIKNNMLINIISYTFLCIIFYLFMWNWKWNINIFDVFQIFIFSIISFAISMFISDKFKINNNKYIKFLQKLVFSSSILVLIGLILYLFDVSIFNTVFCDTDSDSSDIEYEGNNKLNNKEEINKNEEESLKNKDVVKVSSNIDDKNDEYYNIKVRKEIVDKAMNKGKDLIEVGVKDIAPNLGIGAAIGKVTAEAFKHTAGMAPLPRLAIVGGTALTTGAGTVMGIELGKAIVKNTKIAQEVEASKLDASVKSESGRNSPSEIDGGFISSLLEGNEIPLITMVNGLCFLNYTEFSLILALFSLFFRKNFNIFLKRFTLNLKNKYIQNKEVDRINEDNVTIHKAFDTLDKYTNYLILLIFICLFWIKILNIYFSSNLAENIDSFVTVYNHIKDNSFYLLFTNGKSFKTEKHHIRNISNLFSVKKLHRKYSKISNSP